MSRTRMTGIGALILILLAFEVSARLADPGNQTGRGPLVGVANGFHDRVAGARALRVDSTSVDARRKRTWLRFAHRSYDAGRYDLAASRAAKVLAIDPNDKDAIAVVQKTNRAREAYTAWVSLNPDRLADTSPEDLLGRHGVSPSCTPQRRLVRYDDAILAAVLAQRRLRSIDWEAGEMTFENAISYLQGETGVEFVLSRKVREEKAEIEVELQLDNVSAVQVLELITEPHEMGWRIDRGVVEIFDNHQGQASPVLRFYDIEDLVAPILDHPGSSISLVPTRYVPPEEVEPEMPLEVDELIEVIETTIDPESWGRDGASIEPKSAVLVVRALGQVHRDIETFLNDLRAVDLPPPDER